MDGLSWLQRLKVGDEVAVRYTGSFYGRYEFLKVSGETVKFFKVGVNRYRKHDGRQAGSPYSSCLEQLTPELRAEETNKKRHMALRQKIQSVRWRDLPLTTLEAIDAILEAERNASAE